MKSHHEAEMKLCYIYVTDDTDTFLFISFALDAIVSVPSTVHKQFLLFDKTTFTLMKSACV